MSLEMDEIEKAYREFRRAALAQISERIDFLSVCAEDNRKRLAAIQREAKELPEIIAKHEQEIARLRNTSVPKSAPLIVG